MCTTAESDTSLNSVVSGSKPYANCQVGHTFTYGSYPQRWNGDVKPIEWRVLARENDRLLVIAQYCLHSMAYNQEHEDTDWSQCTLRSWLNGEFLHEAFTDEERGNLLEVTLSNPNSPAEWNNVPGGPDTRDKVFLLSFDEAVRYFSDGDERCCRPTAFALYQGALTLSDKSAQDMYENAVYAGNCQWWLRSPGSGSVCAATVFYDGRFSYNSVLSGYEAVRPAVFLAL